MKMLGKTFRDINGATAITDPRSNQPQMGEADQLTACW